MTERRSLWRRLACLTLLALAAYGVGVVSRPQPAAEAGVREVTPKGHFLAGDQRSLPVLQETSATLKETSATLKEISATLRRIDDRLAKIEKTLNVVAARDGSNDANRGRR